MVHVVLFVLLTFCTYHHPIQEQTISLNNFQFNDFIMNVLRRDFFIIYFLCVFTCLLFLYFSYVPVLSL